MRDLTQIALDPSLAEAVKTRTKTSTIREGIRDYQLGPNRFVLGNGEEIPIIITEVIHKRLRQVTLDEARQDGFLSLRQLYDCLLGFYRRLTLDDWITIVRFTLAGANNAHRH